MGLIRKRAKNKPLMGWGGERVSDYSLLINRKTLHIERTGILHRWQINKFFPIMKLLAKIRYVCGTGMVPVVVYRP